MREIITVVLILQVLIIFLKVRGSVMVHPIGTTLCHVGVQIDHIIIIIIVIINNLVCIFNMKKPFSQLILLAGTTLLGTFL